MTTATKPAKRPAYIAFLLRPLRQAPRLVPPKPRKRVPRPLAPRQGRQGAPEARHRQDQGAAGPARRLSVRHRARLRHRRLRDGHVDHARPARRRCAGLGELRRGLGDGRHQAAQARRTCASSRPSTASCPTSPRSISAATCSSPGTAPPRACACPTATGSPPTARASPSSMPPRRCSPSTIPWDKVDVAHLLLAEGAGRRGRARHADPVAARRCSAWRATRRPGRCPRSSASPRAAS